MKSTHLKRKIRNTLLYILCVFLFQELVFRLCFPLPEIENFDRSLYKGDSNVTNSNKHLRNQNWYWESSVDTSVTFLHEMNNYGFRDKEWKIEKEEGKQRILFIGDSFIEGVMSAQDETIPKAFEDAANNEYEVFNAGILGKGLNTYLQVLSDMGPVYKPDVVFFCIYANDLGQKAPVIPEYYLEPTYFNSFKPRLLEILHQYKARGPVFFKWFKKERPYLPKVPSESNPWTTNESGLKKHVTPEIAHAMKEGKFNPHRTNAIFKEEHYLKQQPILGNMFPYLKYFSDKFNIELVIIYIPTRNQVTNHYYQFEKELSQLHFNEHTDLTAPKYQLHQQILKKESKQYGLQFIDLTEEIKTKELQGEHLYWNYDEHMKGEGYELLGKSILKQWKRK